MSSTSSPTPAPSKTSCTKTSKTPVAVAKTLSTGLKQAFTHRPLRRLLIEDTSFEGMFVSTKDYIQPILQSAALSLPFLLVITDKQRTIILVALVYALLSILSSIAARRAHAFAESRGSNAAATQTIWSIALLSFIIIHPWLAHASLLRHCRRFCRDGCSAKPVAAHPHFSHFLPHDRSDHGHRSLR